MMTLGVFVVAVLGQQTVAEVAAKHNERCGGKAEFVVDPAVLKLANDKFDPAARCADAMESVATWCTESVIGSLVSGMSLESSGIDGSKFAAEPRFHDSIKAVTKVKCIVDPRRAPALAWAKAHPDGTFDKEMQELFHDNLPTPFFEWKGDEVTLGIFENTVNHLSGATQRVEWEWKKRAGGVFAAAFQEQAAAAFESNCGAKANMVIEWEKFSGERLYDGRSNPIGMARACASLMIKELAKVCTKVKKKGPAITKVKEVRCGPDPAVEPLYPCLNEKRDVEEDERVAAAADMRHEKYTAKKLSDGCKKKLAAAPRTRAPVLEWKGNTIILGTSVGAANYNEIGAKFWDELEKR